MKKIGIILLLAGLIYFSFSSTETIAELPQKTPPPMKLNDPLPGNLFVELGKIINPTVVNISTAAKPRGGRGYRDPMMDLLEQMWGIPLQQPRDNRPRMMGLGTGFIIREDGLIVTNNHVIDKADIIQVQLSEKSEKLYEAKLIGRDERGDIALIKIKPDGKLPVAALGTSKDVEVGEWVAAFGNPFGHGHTMTKGIISSKGREIEEINRIPLLQTDASINPGNSGGPLVNTKGYVIGVNSAIDARAQGIGFAIPIDEVKKMIPELETRGKVRKGYIGVGLGDLDPDAAEDLGLNEFRGAVIMGVEPNGPAAKAGIKPYDIVTEFNGKKIKNSMDLADTVSDATIGQKSSLKVLRDRKTLELNITPQERTEASGKNFSISDAKSYDGQKAPFNLGFSVIDLDGKMKQDWSIPNDVQKPIVIEVERGSLASQIGIQVGDVILEVNQKEVSTAKDVLKLLKKKTNTIRLARGNRVMIFSFEVR